jgi:hypothetical protein
VLYSNRAKARWKFGARCNKRFASLHSVAWPPHHHYHIPILNLTTLTTPMTSVKCKSAKTCFINLALPLMYLAVAIQSSVITLPCLFLNLAFKSAHSSELRLSIPCAYFSSFSSFLTFFRTSDPNPLVATAETLEIAFVRSRTPSTENFRYASTGLTTLIPASKPVFLRSPLVPPLSLRTQTLAY